MKISILAENTAFKSLHSEWGFCALVETGQKKILYDTGLTGTCAVKNADDLGIELSNIDAMVLSHGHFDHCDGLETLLKHVGGCEVFAHPTLFDPKFIARNGKKCFAGCRFQRAYLENPCGATFNLQPGFHQIHETLYMTGEVPFTNDMEAIPDYFLVEHEHGALVQDTFLDDNSIVIDTQEGLILILGCAHRGLVNIMHAAKQKLGKKIRAIIGGTHLFDVTQDHFDFVVQELEREQVDLIAPAHCTGPDRIFDLKTKFPKQVQPAFCGSQFEF